MYFCLTVTWKLPFAYKPRFPVPMGWRCRNVPPCSAQSLRQPAGAIIFSRYLLYSYRTGGSL
jgi:hypothetical protein